MSDIKMEHYSRALDEIYLLRALLAYEAKVTEAHLKYKTFPRSRRGVAAWEAERMRRAACGEVAKMVAPLGMEGRKSALRDAGADECLTRAQWEESRP